MGQLWVGKGSMGDILNIGMGAAMGAMGMALQDPEGEDLVAGEEDAPSLHRRKLCLRRWQAWLPRKSS